jgi:RecB family endonuclease NucS
VPTSTSAGLEAFQRARLERAIEDLLFHYPELIDPGLKSPERQIALSRDSRADLLFVTRRGVILVEIKRGAITPACVGQIERYARRHQLQRKIAAGFLIGTQLTATAEKKIASSPLRLEYRQLGRDIPLEIKICRHCRHPYDARLRACPHDQETRYL